MDNKCVKIAEDLCLIGLDEYSVEGNKAKIEYADYDSNQFVITALHDPHNCEIMQEINYDLQVSGHTHDGQLFLYGFILSLYNQITYNKYGIDLSKLYVSSGEAGWAFPYRNSGNSAYEMIHLKHS